MKSKITKTKGIAYKSFLYKLIAALFLFSLYERAIAIAPTVITVSGTLATNTTWSADTVKVSGDVTIPVGSSLQINPKTYVKFMGWYQIICQGSIKAIGNTPDSITFAINDSTGFSNHSLPIKGGWQGITINNSQVVSQFTKCIFKNIKQTSDETQKFIGGIIVKGRKTKFDGCRFSSNITSGGVVSTKEGPADSVEIVNCLFWKNIGNSNNSVIGNAVCTWSGTIAILKNNTFLNNTRYGTSYDTYTVTISYSDNNIIDKNTFTGNFNSFYGGALGGIFSNNIIKNDKGTSFFQTAYNSNIYVVNNQFLNNSGGLILSGNSDFVGNIVYKSTQGIYLADNGNILNNNFIYNGNSISIGNNNQPVLNNNIIWRNNSNGTQIYVSNFAEPKFNNCIIFKGAAGIAKDAFADFPHIFNNIINQKPGFVDSTSNFALIDTSVCINKGIAIDTSITNGKDVYGNKRLRNGTIDIGAVEKYFGTKNICSNITTNTQWIADTIKVNCDITINAGASLSIAPGTKVLVAPGKVINVYGPITAIGNADYPILFSCQDTSGFYKSTNEGVWKGLNLYNISGNNTFDYVTIQYAYSPIAVNFVQNLSIFNSKIQYSKADVSNDFNSSRIIFSNTLFYNNNCYLRSSNTNIFMNNCQIFNNLMFMIYGGPNVKFTNTIFANNNSVELDLTDFIMTNCLIAKNQGCRIGYSNPIVSNTIFDQYVEIFGTLSTPKFYNCLFNNNTNMPGENNLYNKPAQYIAPTINAGTYSNGLLANWHLQSTSPCVNAGAINIENTTTPTFDIEGNTRIVGSAIDLGPYENQSAIPVFTFQPIGGNLCAGNNITLHALVNDTVYYQWQKDGQDVVGATNKILVLNSVSPAEQGSYTCKATNSFGTVLSNSVTVNVNSIPEILSTPESRFVTSGSPVSIEVPVSGSKPITILWYKDNVSQPLLLKPELKIAQFGTSTEGTYQMIAQNSCGSDTSTAFTLNILPTTYIQNNDTLLCEGESSALITQASTGSTYQWYKNGSILTGHTSDKIQFPAISKNDEGTYSCIVQSLAGRVETSPILINVKQAPKFTTQPSSQWITENASLTTEVTSSGNSPLTYQWYRSDIAITGENASRLLFAGFTKNDEKIYKCKVINVCGSDISKNAAFMIAPVVRVNTLTGEPVVCENTSVDLLVSAPFSATYQWKKDGQNISSANSSVLSLANVSELSKGNYTCYISNIYGQTETSPVFLQVLIKPTITSEPVSQWIYGGSAFNLKTVVDGSKPIKYNWLKNNVLQNDSLADFRFNSFTLVNEGKYICIVENTCGTDTSNAAKLIVAPELFNPGGTQICENDTFELSVAFNDSATFQWYKDGSLLSAFTGKNLRIAKASGKNTGNYSCRISNAIGFEILGPVQLNLLKAPFVDPLAGITYIDNSLSTTLTANASGDEPINFQWLKNGKALAGKSLENLELDSITSNDEALYFCKVSNVCGSIETNQTKLVIVPQLCMVTNTLTNDSNKNFLIWDRNSKYTYKQYNVYREGSVAGKYQLIGKVPYKSVTAFTDSFVNPKSQAYVYKITALDSSGVETDINATTNHKTIHLLVTQGIPSGIQLDWDEYIGFDYGTYNIYRSTDNGAFAKIHSMASTSRTWTDFDAPTSKTLKYYVSVSRAKPCLANDIRKAGAGPLSSAVSNMEDNSRLRSTSIDLYATDNEASIYPNPFNTSVELTYKLEKTSKVEITITDFAGKQIETVLKNNQLAGEYNFKVGEKLKSGVYLLNVNVGGKIQVLKLVKL